MARFHTLQVSDVRRETSDCVSIAFEIPASLQAEYTYIQGQYLTLKLLAGGEELRRSYSLCSSPLTDTELRIAVKKVKNGKGSCWLNDNLKKGDKVEVMTPMGNFHTPLSAENTRNYVLFAGGSGITPMFSIIKTILKAEPKSTLCLFYGNRSSDSGIFKKELDALASANQARFKAFHILEEGGEEELYKGVLSKEKVRQLILKHVDNKADNEYFICGPGPMMENVKQVLQDLRTDEKKVHIEYFTAVLEAVKKAEAGQGGTGKLLSKVTVIMDGQRTDFELSSEGKVILDAALDKGVDVPYACKGAVCCTCRAKLLEGKVKMDNNYALTDHEVKEGFILTCQSHPLTEKVVVDYDV
ncbi:MAG: 2Fe-2S iron-sulfur cluster-binding protein [Bacteroidia bacterium]